MAILWIAMQLNSLSPEERRERYDRFERWAEMPMMVLSLLVIPVVLMPLTEELSASSEQALLVAGTAIWAGYAIEYIVLVYLSVDRWQTIKTHKLDLALVVLPFFRPLRMVRLVRLAQAGTAFGRLSGAVKVLGLRPGFATTLVSVAGLNILGGGLVAIAENGQAGSSIHGFGDGIWWAIATCTTVGYGDAYPVTTAGRVIAVTLMLAGISALSVVTANIAAYFVNIDEHHLPAERRGGGHLELPTDYHPEPGAQPKPAALAFRGGDQPPPDWEQLEARLIRIEQHLATIADQLADRKND